MWRSGCGGKGCGGLRHGDLGHEGVGREYRQHSTKLRHRCIGTRKLLQHKKLIAGLV